MNPVRKKVLQKDYFAAELTRAQYKHLRAIIDGHHKGVSFLPGQSKPSAVKRNAHGRQSILSVNLVWTNLGVDAAAGIGPKTQQKASIGRIAATEPQILGDILENY